MAKPIPDEVKKEFVEFVRRRHADDETEFSTSGFERFQEEDEDGNPLWEFHASNYDPPETHDFYELFESVRPEFAIEEHGHDEFVITKP